MVMRCPGVAIFLGGRVSHLNICCTGTTFLFGFYMGCLQSKRAKEVFSDLGGVAKEFEVALEEAEGVVKEAEAVIEEVEVALEDIETVVEEIKKVDD